MRHRRPGTWRRNRTRAITATDHSKSEGVSEKTLAALTAIRREKLLEQLYGQVFMARSVYEAVEQQPAWLEVIDDAPDHPLPARVASATASEAATLRAALAAGASLVLIYGPIKEKAKLSFIKCEGAVSILVAAYREGLLTAVKLMVKALTALGHEDVLPPPETLDALWTALDQLVEE